MKKFFEDIKKDIKFKSAGPGKKLTEDTRLKRKLFKDSISHSKLSESIESLSP